MTKRVTGFLCGLLLCGAAASAARAGEKVDNPLYKHWAQFKPGSFSVFKTDNVVNGVKNVTTMTVTLIEVTPEKAVVERKYVSAVAEAGDRKMPSKKEEIPAKIDEEQKAREIGPPKKGAEWKGGEVVDVKEGEEVIQVGEKKFATKWTETQIKTKDAGTATTKVWNSEDVPGQLVKSSSSAEGRMSLVSEGILVDFKAEPAGKQGPGGKPDSADKTGSAQQPKAPDKPGPGGGEKPEQKEKK
jgi:hypothetical protein